MIPMVLWGAFENRQKGGKKKHLGTQKPAPGVLKLTKEWSKSFICCRTNQRKTGRTGYPLETIIGWSNGRTAMIQWLQSTNWWTIKSSSLKMTRLNSYENIGKMIKVRWNWGFTAKIVRQTHVAHVFTGNVEGHSNSSWSVWFWLDLKTLGAPCH